MKFETTQFGLASAEAREIAKTIKAAIFDLDGVIFPSSVYIGATFSPEDPNKGELMKQRSHVDGQGISLLRAAGIQIAFMTAESTGFADALTGKLNSLPSVKDGSWPPIALFSGKIGMGKAEQAEEWLKKIGLAWKDTACMGDDMGDVKMLMKTALPAAPAQAEYEVKELAQFISHRIGGAGAVRDFCNFILDAQGVDKFALKLR